MHKSLPVYFLTILWVVAVVLVFFIVSPLIMNNPEKNDVNYFSDFTVINGNKDPAPVANNAATPDHSIEQSFDKRKVNDLIFYDKTAFIRYFSDTYSEQELTDSYNKALAAKANAGEKLPIRVVMKGVNGKTRKSFSGSFDIRPVPGYTHQ